MHRSLSQGSRGALTSVGSSLAFAGVYFVTPLLAPAAAESIWALRNLIAIPIIFLAVVAVRQGYLIGETAKRIRRRPILLLGIIICGLLIAAQLWVFTWAPMHGRGLNVALGYFLLPLVLVVIGRFLYRDRLVWWQWLAAGIAAVGVVIELIRVGGVSWETLLVALGYPVYFVLRRAIGTGHMGGMFWEFLVLAPVAVAFVVIEIVRGTAMTENPTLWWSAPLFAVWCGVAIVLYVASSRLLTMSIFGLLSYLEPALLVVASLLNGESITGGEWFIYGAIWASVLVLIAGGIVMVLRSRKMPPPSAPSD